MFDISYSYSEHLLKFAYKKYFKTQNITVNLLIKCNKKVSWPSKNILSAIFHFIEFIFKTQINKKMIIKVIYYNLLFIVIYKWCLYSYLAGITWFLKTLKKKKEKKHQKSMQMKCKTIFLKKFSTVNKNVIS